MSGFKPTTYANLERIGWEANLARARATAAPLIERPPRNRKLTIATTPYTTTGSIGMFHRKKPSSFY